MAEEVVFCIDMEPSHASRFRGGRQGFEAACAGVNAFSEAALAKGVPTWCFYYKFGRREEGWDRDIAHQAGAPRFIISDSDKFVHRDLLPELHKQGVRKITIVGCYLNDCVAATAVSAALKGFEVAVVQGLVFDGSGTHAEWTSKQIRRCLRIKFTEEMSLRLRRDHNPIEFSRKTYDLFGKTQFGQAPKETFDEAWAYLGRCNQLRAVSLRFDGMKIYRDMAFAGDPRYAAVESIRIKNGKDLLRGSANRPLPSQPPFVGAAYS